MLDIQKSIADAVMRDIESSVEQEIDKAIEEIRRRIQGRVGQIAAELSKHISYQTMTDQLVITVKFKP
jgi:hypothetical protein